jgi:hypothetical protein
MEKSRRWISQATVYIGWKERQTILAWSGFIQIYNVYMQYYMFCNTSPCYFFNNLSYKRKYRSVIQILCSKYISANWLYIYAFREVLKTIKKSLAKLIYWSNIVFIQWNAIQKVKFCVIFKKVRVSACEEVMGSHQIEVHRTCLLCFLVSRVVCRGLQRDVVYLGWPIASSYMSPNAGDGRGGCGVSANEYSCAHGA